MSGRGEPVEALETTGRGARAVFVLFAVVHIAIAVYGLGGARSAPVALVALVLVLVAGFLVSGGARQRLGRARTGAVVALCVVASGSVWNLPTTGWPGWSSWIWGAITFVAFMLALRGRTASAWGTFVAMTAVTVWWCAAVGRGPEAGVGFVVRSAALLFSVSMFALLLARTRASIVRVQQAARERALAEAAADAALDEQNERLAALRVHAVPALLRVRSDVPFTDDDRRMFALVEGALRDQLRAGRLAAPAVAEAARRARDRGVTVTLLNDRGPSDLRDAEWERVEAAVVAGLDEAQGGEVTARLLPAGRAVLATVVAEPGGGGAVRRVAVAAEEAPGRTA